MQGLPPGSSAARIDAQTPTGLAQAPRARSGVVVVADMSNIVSSSALPDRRLDAARIHQDPGGRP